MAARQGDTWSSEVGVLSKKKPRLILSGRTVPTGTNGAVSIYGLVAAVVGGAVLGLSIWPFSTESLGQLVLKTAAFALIGSLVDSVLGATLQYSGYDSVQKIVVEHPGPNVKRICGRALLDNHQINLLTSVIMMTIGYLL
jgi:uncharacterized protein (TIGR00297 family)